MPAVSVAPGVHVGSSNPQSHPACSGLDPSSWWLSVGDKLAHPDILLGTHPKLHLSGALGKRDQVKALLPPPSSCREGTGPWAVFHSTTGTSLCSQGASVPHSDQILKVAVSEVSLYCRDCRGSRCWERHKCRTHRHVQCRGPGHC